MAAVSLPEMVLWSCRQRTQSLLAPPQPMPLPPLSSASMLTRDRSWRAARPSSWARCGGGGIFNVFDVPTCVSRWPSLGRSFFSTSARRRQSLMTESNFTPTQLEVREAVGRLCAEFPESYWQRCDQEGIFPKELHAALARDGWLGIALPTALGGSGLGIAEATVMMQTIAESGAGMQGAQSVHANVYATQPIARFAAARQDKTSAASDTDRRSRMLTPLIRGETRTCFGVTEPSTGLDTLRLRTMAVRQENAKEYRVTGQKIWITGAQGASHMVLLARTTPLEEVRRPNEGLSLFFIELDRTGGHGGLEIRPIGKMGARGVDANEVWFDDYVVPADTLIGDEGQGWRIVLAGMNAERCLLAGEALGLGYAALAKATKYARERIVFNRPIGANQGVQHPLAECWMALEAAKLATYHAAALYDQQRQQQQQQEQEEEKGNDSSSSSSPSSGGAPRAESTTESTSSPAATTMATAQPLTHDAVGLACNSAKFLAAEAAFRACERSLLAMGGMGYAADFAVERYLREALVPRLAPVSAELIKCYVAERALALPRSY